MSDFREQRGPRARWLLLAALVLVLVAIGIASEAPDHCADYPEGRRCTEYGYVLIVLSSACAVLAAISVIIATIRAITNGRRKRRRETPPTGA